MDVKVEIGGDAVFPIVRQFSKGTYGFQPEEFGVASILFDGSYWLIDMFQSIPNFVHHSGPETKETRCSLVILMLNCLNPQFFMRPEVGV